MGVPFLMGVLGFEGLADAETGLSGIAVAADEPIVAELTMDAS